MGKIHFLFIVSILFTVSLSNCSKKAKYENLVKEGLESGERHDTLFLGLYLGMTAEEFYKKCWDLNKQGIIKQGEANTSVLYEMKDELKSTVNVNFYPTFFHDKIYEMPVKFKYKGWSPWTAEYSGDTLQLELVEIFKKWYGDGFMEVTSTNRGKAFVKIDGNRRISLYKTESADGTVWALYTDMSISDEVEAAKDSLSRLK